MNKRRLLKLADLLEADAKNENGIKFDYYDWGHISNLKQPMSCGTEACALGLAAISGAFKSAGLGYELPYNSIYTQINITYKGRVSDPLQAGMNVFGLTDSEALFLFVPKSEDEVQGAKAEKNAAKKIRELVAGKVHP